MNPLSDITVMTDLLRQSIENEFTILFLSMEIKLVTEGAMMNAECTAR